MMTAILTAAKAAMLALSLTVLGISGASFSAVHATATPVTMHSEREMFSYLSIPNAQGPGTVLINAPKQMYVGAQGSVAIQVAFFSGRVSVTPSTGLTLRPAAPVELYDGVKTFTTQPLMSNNVAVAAGKSGSALWYATASRPGTYSLTVKAGGQSQTVQIHVVAAPLGSVVVGSDGTQVKGGEVYPVMRQRLVSLQILGL